ncbi:MAG: HIT domain-containing protein [Candidatus Omnitrophica bacterium]|nr:HIT domain-containing protein [Candidatus Omnitrophota bacterium]
MDRLWSPWRAPYVQKMKKMKGCLFCKAYKSKDLEKDYVVVKTAHALVMLNIFPYNNGHIMIAPRRHVAVLEDCRPEELSDVMDLARRMMRPLRRILNPSGFNIGMNIGKIAGAGIDQHLHLHVVPRWQGDTNFMPVCAATKIIPQSLDDFYRRLRKEIKG